MPTPSDSRAAPGGVVHVATIERALLCTNHLFRLAGSEVVTLEIARSLKGRGIAVDLAAREVGPEIEEEIRAAGARVVDLGAVDPFDYDLLYVQHALLAPLFASRSPDAKKTPPVVITAHLSPYEEYEAPGPVAEEALSDIILANSPETAAALHAVGGAFAQAEVFANPAPREFFRPGASAPSRLGRLVAVSNHLPAELVEALEILERRGTHVTRIGRGHEVRRVTPELVAGYDAVVSIGKTVQYALASRRPVYCYDRFGGPGWLGAANFERAAWHNFSGRGFDRRLAAEALATEILHGYPAAAAHVATLTDAQLAPYDLEAALGDLLDRAAVLLNDPGRDQARREVLADADFRRRLAGEANLMSIVAKEFARRRKLESARADKPPARLRRRTLFARLWRRR